MICSKCGNSIPKEDDFCSKCGHKITVEEHRYDTGVVKNSTMSILRSPMFGAVCICLIAFIACVILGWFFPLDFKNYAEGLRRIGAPENIASLLDVSDETGRLQIVKILMLFVVSLPIVISTIGLLILRSYANGKSRVTGLDVVKTGLRVGIIKP